jgi:hypothetical protein
LPSSTLPAIAVPSTTQSTDLKELVEQMVEQMSDPKAQVLFICILLMFC